MVLDNDSRLGGDMYCKEQIFVDSTHMWEIKRLEKAVLRYTNAGYQVDVMDQIRFCRDWFAALKQEVLDRIAREEAWRREWSGKKGQIKRLFDQIDADGSGSIDIQELEEALKVLPDFFGYGMATGGGSALADALAEVEGMPSSAVSYDDEATLSNAG